MSDIGLTCIGYTTERATFIDYTVPVFENVFKWASKTPEKTTAATNLITIFDKTSWILAFLSLVLVSCCLVAANKLELFFGGKEVDTVSLILAPFAMLNAEAMPVEKKKNSKCGYARNLILLLWSVMGMVLVFCFLCNLRAVILKPTMENPIDTTEDLVRNGITPILNSGLQPEYMATSGNEWHRKAEQIAFIIHNPALQKEYLMNVVQQDGTHSVLSVPYLVAYFLKDQKSSTAIHFSKENIQPYYIGWVTAKQSPWKKILDNHIGLIVQVSENVYQKLLPDIN